MEEVASEQSCDGYHIHNIELVVLDEQAKIDLDSILSPLDKYKTCMTCSTTSCVMLVASPIFHGQRTFFINLQNTTMEAPFSEVE